MNGCPHSAALQVATISSFYVGLLPWLDEFATWFVDKLLTSLEEIYGRISIFQGCEAHVYIHDAL